MASWEDVGRICATLDGSKPGVAHEESPSYDIGRHPFARLRQDDDGHEIVQYWSWDLDSRLVLAGRRDTFVRIDTFEKKASIWARLDRLDVDELTELLTDSWRARRGVH